MRATYTIALLGALLTANCRAQISITAGELLRDCEHAERWLSARTGTSGGADVRAGTQCFAYVTGVWHGVMVAEVGLEVERGRQLACPPAEVTTAQLTRIVAKFLRDNPARHHQPAQVPVAFAIRDAFPCSK